MAYNRQNILTRIIDIQQIVLDHKKRGVSQEWVYTNLIYPTYRISRTTFYSYLACNAKSQLKKIEAVQRQQPTLFETETPT